MSSMGRKEEENSERVLEDESKAEKKASQESEPEQCVGDQPVGDKDNDLLSRSTPFELTDSVNDRLVMLQQLIPHGQEIDKEEILQVAVEYVRALEQEIQTFDKSKQDGNVMEQGCLEKSPNANGNALQQRGLCVVPISALDKVF